MIEQLAEPASEEQEPEQEYAVARVLADPPPSGPPHSLHQATYTVQRVHQTADDLVSCTHLVL